MCEVLQYYDLAWNFWDTSKYKCSQSALEIFRKALKIIKGCFKYTAGALAMAGQKKPIS